MKKSLNALAPLAIEKITFNGKMAINHRLMQPFVKSITSVFIICLLLFGLQTKAQQNIAPPTPNISTAPAGSLVIAMDNVLQANSSADFNLKSYGLIVQLLNNYKKLHWVIRAGKTKDAVDFTATADRVFPTAQAAASRNFISGPFVIYAQDTSGCAQIINAFNNSLAAADRVSVYRLSNSAQVDVRYDLNLPVYAGIMDEGGAYGVHEGYMQDASIPTTNYEATNRYAVNSKCYTFVSEPHNNDGPWVDSVNRYILRGGNFLAECAAIIAYEQHASTGGFQTTGGFDNVNIDINNEVVFPQPDLSYIQVNGLVKPKQGGNTQTYSLNPGSTTKNDFSATTKGSTLHPEVYGASESDMLPGQVGGHVFYLGNHRYDNNSEEGINGIRMYFNAMLTPSSHSLCPSMPPPPPPPTCPIGGVNLGNLTNYLFVFTDGNDEANWQSASKGYIGDVAVDGVQANEKTSGSFAYAGTIHTNSSTLSQWQDIVDNNPGQAFSSLNQTTRLSDLEADLNSAFTQINALPVTAAYNGINATSLDGLNTQNGITERFVINVTSGFTISSRINITGDPGDIFIFRWDNDAIFSNGYNGLVKFQSGGAIVPLGGLKASNFIHVAGDIAASGGGSTPSAPYPQGPRTNNGTGALITGGSDFSGGGFFTGYWLTTGNPSDGKTSSLSNAVFVGGWYSSTIKFSLTSGTSGVHIAPAPCVPTPTTNPDFNTTWVNVPVPGNVSTNDRVPSGTTYGTTPTLLSSPAGSTPSITMNPDGTYSFVSNVKGVYVYNVPVCVPGQAPPCPPTKLTITVLDALVVNNSPVANVDIATTKVNTPVTLKSLANDAAGNLLNSLVPSSVIVTVAPLHGTASVNLATGDITYTPAAGYTGKDTLTYQVCDDQAPPKCASANQIITIIPAGAPNTTEAADDYKITNFNTVATGNVKINDTDAEGNTQTVTAQNTTVAGKGNLVLGTNGDFTFTPVNNFTGPVDYPYTTCDNGVPQACAMATLHILVRPLILVPDLTPNITTIPNIITDTMNFNVTVRVQELDNAATNGSEILVRIIRDPRVTFTYNPALTNIGFTAVQNNVWAYDGTDPFFHLFRTFIVIPANGNSTFGFVATFNPGGKSRGKYTMTASLNSGSGGEIKTNNNQDAEVLDYLFR